MIGIALLASAIMAATPTKTDVLPGDETIYHQALECSVYSRLAKSIHASNPSAVAMDNKLDVYWTKRSEEIGAKAGLTSQTVSMQSLVIEIKAERFTPVMLACLQATPEKALR